MQVNSATEVITGYTSAELSGKKWFDLVVAPEQVDRMWQMFTSNIGRGTMPKVYENIIVTKSGAQRYISWQNSILQEDEQVIGTISFGLDITERAQAEDALRQLSAELELRVAERTEALQKKTQKLIASELALKDTLADITSATVAVQKANKEYTEVNRELTEFAYIVSHDLKAPLRAISQLTHWIATDYSKFFDADGRMQMELILQRVKRMDALIDGILNYSRIGRVREQSGLLDLNLVVAEVIADIAPPDDVQVTIANQLPTLESDATRMRQVFQNLIGNAVKFMDKSPGLVQVGCSEDDECWTFSIRDNGPGIKSEYYAKIFKIFQTLSARDDHESTGIGLSLVKKIVNRYGGSIWLESAVGSGTTFFFTLPKMGVADETL